MDNKYENIDSQNQEIFDLIQEEFQNENIQDEIKFMVAQKIKGTDFASLSSATKISTLLGNGLYYFLGIIVVGAITFYYFSTNNNKENTNVPNISKDELVSNSQVSEFEQELNVNIPKTNDIGNATNSAESKEIIIKETESEFMTIESQEYQHSQTLKISNELSDEYVYNSFMSIFQNLNFEYQEKVTEKSISLTSKRIYGKFDNQSVEYFISVKFSKLDRNKIVATLHYKDVPTKVEDINVNEIFYESLISELQKYF